MRPVKRKRQGAEPHGRPRGFVHGIDPTGRDLSRSAPHVRIDAMKRPLRHVFVSFIMATGVLAQDADDGFGTLLDDTRTGNVAEGEGRAYGQPLRWWINYDDDDGEWQAGRDTPGLGRPDWTTSGIDGQRDLVDFFPVRLGLESLFAAYGHDGVVYELRCATGGLEAYPVAIPPYDAGAVHRQVGLKGFGHDLSGGLETAEPVGLAKGGWVPLPQAFLSCMAPPAAVGRAMLLCEGLKAGLQRLELRVRTSHGGTFTAHRDVVISPVEDMYRTLVAGPSPSRMSEPRAMPDLELAEGWTVFVHGYNVPPAAARGWNAEMFKRLYALGCRRKYVGVLWNGATGLDYHAAVRNAFFAGRALGARASSSIKGGTVVLIAHSLGNVVAGEAVERGGWRPDKYYMVNAAVPAEAYTAEDTDPSHAFHMTDVLWRGYERRLHASSWHALFPKHDYRSQFGWSGAFGGIPKTVEVINAYSEGEDVTNCPEDVDSASLLSALINGRDYGNGVWKTQELLKGVSMTRSLGTLFMRRGQAGWGFNERWKGRYVLNGVREPGGYYLRMTPDEAARLTDEQLRAQPFFGRFLWDRLHEPRPRRSNTSAQERAMFADVLARGVPARSYAAGCHAMDLRRLSDFNLESDGRLQAMGWPRAGHEDGRKSGRWLHSDFRNVALPYVHPFFRKLSR